MHNNVVIKGDKGEDVAVKYLQTLNYEIIERKYHFGHGEIDIIAKDPLDGYLVFVEVKTRYNLECGHPEDAVTPNKQKQLKKIAECYLYEKEIKEVDCRFDVVSVLFYGGENYDLKHFKFAFI